MTRLALLLVGLVVAPLPFAAQQPPAPRFEVSSIKALREQLGLRLERTRGLVPFIVIESAERPTPN